jgi:hypothetical protein
MLPKKKIIFNQLFIKCNIDCIHYLSDFPSEYVYEETIAKIYNLSNMDIFKDCFADGYIFRVSGTYADHPFILYDRVGGAIHIDGTDELDIDSFKKKLSKLIRHTKPKNFSTNTNCETHSLCSYPDTYGITYVMLQINYNLGSDMVGTYFVQYTGNKKNIKKFLLINTKGDVKYYPKKYYYDQVIALTEFEHLFDMVSADNVEVLLLAGKFRVPGENREYEKKELMSWWETYLDWNKAPTWSNITEEVVNLAK